jgi:hypothetical protein
MLTFFRLRSMRTYTALLFLLYGLSSFAASFEGSGHAPKQGDVSFSRLLASLDAYSDALLKAGGELESQAEVSRNVLSKHTFRVSLNQKTILMRNKICEEKEDHFQCRVLIEVSPYSAKKKSSRALIQECQQEDSLQFCYKVLETSNSLNPHFSQTALRGEFRVQWGSMGKNKILGSVPFQVMGIGETAYLAHQSGLQQLRAKARQKAGSLFQTYLELKNYREIRFKRKLISTQQRMYLSYLGGECLCHQNECVLLLPKLFF